MADEPKQGAAGGDGNQDIEYWKAEAKAAFAKRDEKAKELEALRGRSLSEAELTDLRESKKRLAEIEEERQRKAGEFDSLRQKLEQTHKTETEKLSTQLSALQREIAESQIGSAFARADALFGPQGETVLLPDVAQAYFASHVAYEEADVAGRKIKTVVVKDSKGEVLRDKDGNPVPLADGLRLVIAGMPKDKQDRLLRGSGRPGSGSPSGGSHNHSPSTLNDLIRRTQAGDKEAAKLLAERQRDVSGVTTGPIGR